MNATELPISNSTYVYLYFTYTQTTHQIIITAIPDYLFLILSLFMAAALIAVAIHKKKYSRP